MTGSLIKFFPPTRRPLISLYMSAGFSNNRINEKLTSPANRLGERQCVRPISDSISVLIMKFLHLENGIVGQCLVEIRDAEGAIELWTRETCKRVESDVVQSVANDVSQGLLM